VVLLAFSVPKAYELKKDEVDDVLNSVQKQSSSIYKQFFFRVSSPMLRVTRVGLLKFTSSLFRNDVFVGNLSFKLRSTDLEKEFAKFGQIEKANVITDRETGRSKGYGFVTFASSEAAESAIREMDGFEVDGRRLRVSVPTATRG